MRWQRRGKHEAAKKYAEWARARDLKDVVDETSGVMDLIIKLHAVVLGWVAVKSSDTSRDVCYCPPASIKECGSKCGSRFGIWL